LEGGFEKFSSDVLWGDDDLKNMILVGNDYAIISTSSSISVPVFIEYSEVRPVLDFEIWDHVNLFSMHVSGNLVVSGDFNDENEVLDIQLPDGSYGFYVCYSGLGSIANDGLNGNDSYHVFIWPILSLFSNQVLKE
jgi:hypothetical protein